MAFFGVDLWNPTKVGFHSTNEKSRDQWVKRNVVYVRVEVCMNINKMNKRLILRLVVKLGERPLQYSTLQLNCGKKKRLKINK